MKCNKTISLGIVSIILIISITILVLYKNTKDNTENFDLPQEQNYADQLLIFNNHQINNSTDKLVRINPTVGFASDPIAVDNDYLRSTKKIINSQTNNMTSHYLSNNNVTNAQIDKLENNIIDLENIINNNKIKNINQTKYNYIKSLNNGMEMRLFSTPNTIFQDETTGKITAGYLVNVNDGCLSVGATGYDVYKCNDKNPKQLFKMQHIINETDYSGNIDKALPFDNVNKAGVNYPFAMIKSINNKECLTNNHGTLTVQPCYSFNAQRWIPI